MQFSRVVRAGVFALALTIRLFASPSAPAFAAERVDDVQPGIPTALIELDGTSSEHYDGGTLSYEWTQLDGPRVELSDPAAAKPYFRTGKPGLYRFQLVVTSNGLRSDPFVVEIMIERDKLPPVAKSPAEVRGEVGRHLEIDGGGSFDPDGAALVYRWRFLSGDPGVPPEALSRQRVSFVPEKDGVYELELVVSNGEAVSRPAVTRMYIKPKPKPPVAKAKAVAREIPAAPAADQAAVPPAGGKPVARIEGPAVGSLGKKLMLDARGSRGADGARLSYLWRQKSGPFVSDFETVFDGAAERFTPPRAGEYEFELVVSDGVMDSEPAFHALKVVNDTDPPVAVVVAPERVAPGALVKLDATQSYDLEGSPLIYRWRQTGGPKVTRYLIDDALGDAAPAFHPPASGLYSFELVVSNGRLQSRPVSLDIAVGAVAVPVGLTIESPHVVAAGQAFTLLAKMSEAGGRSFVLNWRQVEGPPGSRGKPEGDALTVTLPEPGKYVFDVSAVENGTIAATARQVVEAFGRDSLPVLAANQPASGAMPFPESANPAPVPPPAAPPPVSLPPMPAADDGSALEPLEPLWSVETAPATMIPPPPMPAADDGSALAPLEPLRSAETALAPSAPPTRRSVAQPTASTPAARPVAFIHPSTRDGGMRSVQGDVAGDQIRRIPVPAVPAAAGRDRAFP